MSKCQYNADFLYKPQRGWVYNEKGEEKKIKEKYSRYWKEEKCFNPNASLEQKLHFLYKKGEYEMVGVYYRNKRRKGWTNDEELRKEYGRERNLNEGFNSYLKQHCWF